MTYAGSFKEERRATYAGFETREVVVRGAGPTIVLFHGFANSTDAWLPVLHLLHDARQSAVAVDLPGFGDADALARGELIPQLDSFAAAVVRHYGAHEGAVVVGNSLGAAVTVRAARNKDLPIAAVMPLDIAGITWTPIVSRMLTPLVAASGLLAHIHVPAGMHRTIVTRSLNRGLYGEKSAVDPAVIELMAAGFPDVETTYRVIRLGAKFKRELDRTRDHGGVCVPMTVVHGARDPLVPVSASRTLHEANPDSTLVVLPNAGHCPQLDAAPAISRLAMNLADPSADKKEIS